MSRRFESELVCTACGTALEPDTPYPTRCPRADEPGIDHLIARRIPLDGCPFPSDEDTHPFVRYRDLLHAYRLARRQGMRDVDWIRIVRDLDASVAQVAGQGLVSENCRPMPALAAELGLDVELWVGDESREPGGSHKLRHLFGLGLQVEVAAQSGLLARAEVGELAIASCGNAALSAAIVARAIGQGLRVFAPEDVPATTRTRLQELGATLELCARDGEPGDPCMRRFAQAVRQGARPFGVQGPWCGLSVEGAQTIIWELLEERARHGVADFDRLLVQVGGGALASACVHALHEARALGLIKRMPRVHCVQTRACHPLVRAWQEVQRLAPAGEAGEPWAAAQRETCMRAWEEEPKSIARGILDDETYDWRAPVFGMRETGAEPVLVDEPLLEAAHELASGYARPSVSPTGSAGLAGLMQLQRMSAIGPQERVVVLFTGAAE